MGISFVTKKTKKMGTQEMDFLKDIEPGPLDEYRRQASFDWKQMALVMEDEKLLRFKVHCTSLIS